MGSRIATHSTSDLPLSNTEITTYSVHRIKYVILAEYDCMAGGLTLDTPLAEGESGTYHSTLTPPPLSAAPARRSPSARAPATTDPLLSDRICGHPGVPLAHPRNQRTWYVEVRAATPVRSSS